jgi:hypothetical protein
MDKTAKAFVAVVAVAGALTYAAAPSAKTRPAICANQAPAGPAALYQILETCGWPKSLPLQVQRSLGEYMATRVYPVSPSPATNAALTHAVAGEDTGLRPSGSPRKGPVVPPGHSLISYAVPAPGSPP